MLRPAESPSTRNSLRVRNRDWRGAALVFGLLVLLGLVLWGLPALTTSVFDDIRESHIQGNVPDAGVFHEYLARDLTAEFARGLEQDVKIEFELLRDFPTQVGVSYPKYYAWVTALKQDGSVLDGAVRVAAVDKERFDVREFLSRAEILKNPEAVSRIFPRLLVDGIQARARGK